MAASKNIAKRAVSTVDSALKFIQQSFNINNSSGFEGVYRALMAIARSSSGEYSVSTTAAAGELASSLNKNTILINFNNYNKFDRLANLDLSDIGVRQVMQVKNEIIRDIHNAQGWLRNYEKFKKGLTNNQPTIENTHDELIALGTSILGRAVELCPIDTGFLRSSAKLYDFGDHIIIAFTADYASYVHENLAINHPNHSHNPDCHGRAKFLEIALQEFFPDEGVWTETLGQGVVAAKISINPLWLEYIHYG